MEDHTPDLEETASDPPATPEQKAEPTLRELWTPTKIENKTAQQLNLDRQSYLGSSVIAGSLSAGTLTLAFIEISAGKKISHPTGAHNTEQALGGLMVTVAVPLAAICILHAIFRNRTGREIQRRKALLQMLPEP